MRFIFGFLVGNAFMALVVFILVSSVYYELRYQQGIVDRWEQLNSEEESQ